MPRSRPADAPHSRLVVEPVRIAAPSRCGLQSCNPLFVIADFDELRPGRCDAGDDAVARDRVRKQQRLDRRRFEERLVVLDRPQAAKAEDRADRLSLAPVQAALPTRFGSLLGGLRGLPEAERLVAHWGRPTRAATRHLVAARAPYHPLAQVGEIELVAAPHHDAIV